MAINMLLCQLGTWTWRYPFFKSAPNSTGHLFFIQIDVREMLEWIYACILGESISPLKQTSLLPTLGQCRLPKQSIHSFILHPPPNPVSRRIDIKHRRRMYFTSKFVFFERWAEGRKMTRGRRIDLTPPRVSKQPNHLLWRLSDAPNVIVAASSEQFKSFRRFGIWSRCGGLEGGLCGGNQQGFSRSDLLCGMKTDDGDGEWFEMCFYT